MIPPYLIAYAMNIVAFVGAILAWFVIVFTGKLPRGIQSAVGELDYLQLEALFDELMDLESMRGLRAWLTAHAKSQP